MKLSVIIPNYNNGKYIKKCIDSILKQSFKDFELIIVDDGSSDNSKEIINSYTDKRIAKIFQYNQNASIARNRGIEISKGEYIYFIDSDDELFDNNTFETIINEIESNDLLIGNYITIDKESNIIDKYFLEKSEVLNTGLSYDYCLISPVPSNKLYKKDIITKYNLFFDNVKIGQDLNFFLKYLSVCKSIKTTDSFIYKYRIVDTSMSRKISSNFLDIFNSFQGIKNFCIKNNNLGNYNKYFALAELYHYNYQINKIKKIKKIRARHAFCRMFSYYYSTINKKECYKSKKYYKIKRHFIMKKLFYSIF